MTASRDLYPVAIIQDRYCGTYSGGKWIAIAEADKLCEFETSRVEFCLTDGPHGDDVEAAEFWADPPDWIAVGNSPDRALLALTVKAGARKVKP